MVDFGMIAVGQPGVLDIATIIILLIAFSVSLKLAFSRLESAINLRRNFIVVANLCVVFAILGLILKPELKYSEREKVRLITMPVTEKNIAKLQSVDYPSYWLTTKNLEKKLVEKNSDFHFIRDPQQILIRHPNIAEIEVLGDGLPRLQWRGFNNVKVDYTSPELVTGLVDVAWQKSINLGRYLHIKGKLQVASDLKKLNADKSGNQIYQLRLIDPGDEIVAETKVLENEIFKLSAQPKLAGQHRYKIQLVDSRKNVLSEEFANVSVTSQQKARILILQSAPSFETKKIQNWAAERGAKIVVRTKISRDKFITRNINYSSLKNVTLSQQLFSLFDLIILDGRTLSELSVPQGKWLKQAVNQGLGLIIQADTSLIELSETKQNDFLTGIRLKSIKEVSMVVPYWSDNNDGLIAMSENLLPVLPAQFKTVSHQLSNIEPLAYSENGNTLVLSYGFGRGTIAISLIRETHRWVTSANKNWHGHFWQNLFEKVARVGVKSRISILENTGINFSHDITKLCISEYFSANSGERINLTHLLDYQPSQQVLINSTPSVNGQSCGYFWPQKSGWFKASITNSKPNSETDNSTLESWMYVDPPERWYAVQQQEKVRATLAMKANYNPVKDTQLDYLFRKINPWIFWWIFLLAVSFIWLERKMS